MAQNISLWGANYSNVPAVDLPKTGGGEARFADPSITTAVEADVASGKIFLKVDGSQGVGTGSGGGSGDGYVWQDAQGYVHLSDEQGTQTVVEPLSVTENGTYTAQTGHAYSPVTVNVSGGGDSSYTLLDSIEVSASTTSGSATTIGTIAIGDSLYTASAIIYVKIRDKAGKRNGFFYGTDTFFVNAYAGRGESQSLISIRPTILYSFDGNGKTKFSAISTGYVFTNSTGSYGVYAASITGTGGISIQARYNTNTGTIDGTYRVDIYLLKWADDSSPISTVGE